MGSFSVSVRRLSAAVLLPAFSLALRPSGAAAQTPHPIQGTSQARATMNPAEGPLPIFEFYSGLWINLHHFLYQQAKEEELVAAGGTGSRAKPASATGARRGLGESGDAKPLSSEERRIWTRTLAYYHQRMAGRDLLFDGDMVLINDRLAELESCADLSGRSSPRCASGLQPELISALEGAEPIYRAHWWAQQDGANRAWISAVSPLVRQLGERLARQLAGIYQTPWPSAPIRVDVTAYAGSLGAYTSLDPLHITISSTDARNQGPAALEILFHEGSHALAGGVRDAIARECRERSKPIPRDLWHALLFYTTGEVVERALKLPVGQGASSSKDYTPYAYQNQLYQRDWQNYEHLLELYWQPYLDGQTDFTTSVERLAAAL